MDYPQKIMKMKELIDMGLPREFLMKAFRDESQDFAWKIHPEIKNSVIVFDTEGLERYRIRYIKLQRDINKKRVGVM